MSYYDPSSDVDRLNLQSEIHLDIDKRAIARVLPFLSDRKTIRVLDVGCGTGVVTASRFGEERYSVTAIDISPTAIEIARQRHSSKNVEYIVGDVHSFNITEKFDLIWAVQFLQHVEVPSDTLQHLWGLLSSGGVLVLRNSDDGMDFTYPPKEHFSSVISLTGALPNSSDRSIGRKLYYLLKTSLCPTAGKIDINFEVVSNLNKTPEQLDALFAVRHGFRLGAIRAATTRHPDLQLADPRQTEEFYREGLAQGWQAFSEDPATISFTVQVIASARKV